MCRAVVVGLVLLIAGPAAPAGAAAIHVEDERELTRDLRRSGRHGVPDDDEGDRRTPAGPEDVSASSAYQAGAEDPDELRSTIDRQTLRIKILRPPDSDVVPYVVPDDDTLTPGQVVDLVERIINDGNRPAPRVRACLRLDAKFDQQTGRCQTVRRLEPGEGIYRRIRLRVPLDACAGRVTHRLRVTVSGRRARTARATGRVLAGPCGNAPCPTARTAWTLPRPPVIARIAC